MKMTSGIRQVQHLAKMVLGRLDSWESESRTVHFDLPGKVCVMLRLDYIRLTIPGSIVVKTFLGCFVSRHMIPKLEMTMSYLQLHVKHFLIQCNGHNRFVLPREQATTSRNFGVVLKRHQIPQISNLEQKKTWLLRSTCGTRPKSPFLLRHFTYLLQLTLSIPPPKERQ